MITYTVRTLAVPVSLVTLFLVVPGSLWAAAFFIDDTSPNETITASANDFEFGLFLNDSLFQQGLNNPATGTFAETGPLNFSGTWITQNQQPPTSGIIYLVETPFVPGTAPPLISDIFRYTVQPNSDNGTATISGSFISDVDNNLGPLPSGTDPTTVFLENGNPVPLDFAFLSIRIASDAEPRVPEPGSVCLAALGLIGVVTITIGRGQRCA